MIFPTCAAPSVSTWPSLSSNCSAFPPIISSSFVDQFCFCISHKFIPHTSLISIGAIFPRKRLARKLEASEILVVFAYLSGFFSRNFSICGPVNRFPSFHLYCETYVICFRPSNSHEISRPAHLVFNESALSGTRVILPIGRIRMRKRMWKYLLPKGLVRIK